jgi:hypothetical protein
MMDILKKKNASVMQTANTHSWSAGFRVKMQHFLAFQIKFAYQKFITVII